MIEIEGKKYPPEAEPGDLPKRRAAKKPPQHSAPPPPFSHSDVGQLFNDVEQKMIKGSTLSVKGRTTLINWMGDGKVHKFESKQDFIDTLNKGGMIYEKPKYVSGMGPTQLGDRPGFSKEALNVPINDGENRRHIIAASTLGRAVQNSPGSNDEVKDFLKRHDLEHLADHTQPKVAAWNAVNSSVGNLWPGGGADNKAAGFIRGPFKVARVELMKDPDAPINQEEFEDLKAGLLKPQGILDAEGRKSWTRMAHVAGALLDSYVDDAYRKEQKEREQSDPDLVQQERADAQKEAQAQKKAADENEQMPVDGEEKLDAERNLAKDAGMAPDLVGPTDQQLKDNWPTITKRQLADAAWDLEINADLDLPEQRVAELSVHLPDMPVVDDEGNPVLDADGNPVLADLDKSVTNLSVDDASNAIKVIDGNSTERTPVEMSAEYYEELSQVYQEIRAVADQDGPKASTNLFTPGGTLDRYMGLNYRLNEAQKQKEAALKAAQQKTPEAESPGESMSMADDDEDDATTVSTSSSMTDVDPSDDDVQGMSVQTNDEDDNPVVSNNNNNSSSVTDLPAGDDNDVQGMSVETDDKAEAQQVATPAQSSTLETPSAESPGTSPSSLSTSAPSPPLSQPARPPTVGQTQTFGYQRQSPPPSPGIDNTGNSTSSSSSLSTNSDDNSRLTGKKRSREEVDDDDDDDDDYDYDNQLGPDPDNDPDYDLEQPSKVQRTATAEDVGSGKVSSRTVGEAGTFGYQRKSSQPTPDDTGNSTRNRAGINPAGDGTPPSPRHSTGQSRK